MDETLPAKAEEWVRTMIPSRVLPGAQITPSASSSGGTGKQILVAAMP